jgi:hypothetical protein
MRLGSGDGLEAGEVLTMAAIEVERALHWRCPSCGLQWVEVGSGFPGSRFSECLRCGRHASEGTDGGAAPLPPVGPLPRVRRLGIRRR